MKKLIIFSLMIIGCSIIIFAQETNGQFRERVFQVDDRFVQLYRVVTRNGYYESVDFETYLENYAKLSAYAEFLSRAYDRIGQIFSTVTSRETLRSWVERSDTLYDFYQDVDEWANKLTDEATLRNDASWEEAGYNIKSTWAEVFRTRKNFFVWQLESRRASRL